MANYNPYSPPAAADFARPVPRAPEEGLVPDSILEAMRQTSPWVTFLSILGFIGAGLMVLGGLVVLVAGGLGKVPAAFGLVYLLGAALYVAPSIFLWNYGSSIRRLLATSDMMSLSDAIGQQRSFWRLVGIMTAAVMGLYFLGILLAFVVAILAA
jgi:hypothetical protein